MANVSTANFHKEKSFGDDVREMFNYTGELWLQYHVRSRRYEDQGYSRQ